MERRIREGQEHFLETGKAFSNEMPGADGLGEVHPMIDDYLIFLTESGRRPSSIATYRLQLERCLRMLAIADRPTDPTRIGSSDILWLRSALSVSDQTVRLYLSTLDGWIEWSTGRSVLRPMRLLWNRAVRRRPFITLDDLAKMYAAAEPTMRLALVLGAGMGLRRSEIAGLRVGDIRGDMMRIRGKGHGPEGLVTELPMPTRVRQELDRYASLRCLFLHPPSAYVLDLGGSAKARGNRLSMAVKALGEEVGVEATAHSLRRLYATTLYRGGVDVLTIRDLMRHADAETTLECYIKADDQQAKEAVAGIGSALADSLGRAGGRPRR